MSATRVVIEMYEKFPEIYFYREFSNGREVELYFECNGYPKECVEFLKNEGLPYSYRNYRLKVYALED